MIGHLPVTLAIAASGAAMVSLVEHAADARTPAATSMNNKQRISSLFQRIAKNRAR